ncbi:MAG: ATP-binding cassette domain-containing protein, partial [Chloroflexota bacterium]|nr:ATP-binding cassette domain-containing protein [Chloroflexota bacterium]
GRVRALIGVAGQTASLDELLTGHENLVMVGNLYRLRPAESHRRANELLERFELTDAADRIVKTYSGGMRRRLDLAAALIDTPPVLFLDEPTTGLDPRSRLAMWSLIADLAKGGTTLLMTTQYLEEADQLADDIAVVDHGRVIARGTALELKRRVGGERLEVEIGEGQNLDRAAEVLSSLGEEPARVDADHHRVSVPIVAHDGVLTNAVRALDTAGIHVDDIGFRRPSLDEVFLALTGQPLESGEPNPEG